MRILKLFAVSLFIGSCLAIAQTPVGIYGYDLSASDAGTIRKVRVDSQGRLVTSGSATTDAGVTVSVPYCTVTQSRATSVGTTATAVPASPLAGKWFTRVCNSPRNSGTPIVSCTSDGTTPDAGLLGNGDALEVGDCVTYTTGAAITCISDTVATGVSSEECR